MPGPDLDATLRELIDGFARAGHPIEARVRVRVRPGLRAAATTLRDGDGYLVLVSDHAVGEGAPALLLAHELGHVQRMASGHASHDDDAITAAYERVERTLRHPYQRAILHHVINHTQDLYADPVSLRVTRSMGLADEAQLDALIERFANDRPYEIADPLERRWDRTEDMVGNARAIALAQLAGAPRALAHARATQERYLTRIEPDIAAHAGWFEARLLDLPEDVTPSGFRDLLVEYVQRFVEVANG